MKKGDKTNLKIWIIQNVKKERKLRMNFKRKNTKKKSLRRCQTI